MVVLWRFFKIFGQLVVLMSPLECMQVSRLEFLIRIYNLAWPVPHIWAVIPANKIPIGEPVERNIIYLLVSPRD